MYLEKKRFQMIRLSDNQKLDFEKEAFIDISEKFEDHFNIQNNTNIFLSGRFGSGKTTFIDSFFLERAKHNVIKLSPVNYSVATNEDIFELLKVDIIIHLLRKKIIKPGKQAECIKILEDIVKNDETIGLSLFNFMSLGIATATSISTESSIPVSIAALLTNILPQFVDKYKETKESLETNYNLAFELLEKQRNQIGSIYEEDKHTQLINTFLKACTSHFEFESNILIIDDLDRLDPHHIFRLLNIIGSHTYNVSRSKFGFDKIIVIGDHKAIECIYKHRYGKESDFKGYLDKFFSNQIFNFNIADSQKSIVEYQFDRAWDKLKLTHLVNKINEDNFIYQSEFNGIGIESTYRVLRRTFTSIVLRLLLDKRQFNLRNVSKISTILSKEEALKEGVSEGRLLYLILKDFSDNTEYNILDSNTSNAVNEDDLFRLISSSRLNKLNKRVSELSNHELLIKHKKIGNITVGYIYNKQSNRIEKNLESTMWKSQITNTLAFTTSDISKV